MRIKTWLVQGVVDFALAWRLLTIIPLPFVPDEPHPVPGRAAGFFPLVGLVLGLLLAGVGWILSLFLPPNLAAALLLVVWVGLSGMLHLDGFMDSCDGLLPPRDPARRLEIMQDSRVGAFGVVGVILLLLIKFNALTALSGSSLSVLVVAPVLARWAVTWAMRRYPLARKEGLSVLFTAGLDRTQLVLASVVAVIVAVLFLGWLGGLLLGVVWLTTVLVARLAMVRIGGLTGDVYGAICEIAEAAVLIVAVAVCSSFALA